MTIKFRTTGTVPTASGVSLSDGTFNGNYYAVDRTASSTSTLLVDNFTTWPAASGTWPGQASISGNTLTISAGTTQWNPPAGNYVAIDRTVIINGGAFCKSSQSSGQGGTAVNSAIYFINCNIIINSTPTWSIYTMGQNAIANDSASNQDFGPGQTTRGGMMFWGCTFITNKSIGTWGFAPSEMIGCSINLATAGDVGLIGAAQNGRYINTDISGFGDNTLRSWQMYGIPSTVRGCTFFAWSFGNIGNGVGNPLLLISPTFTYPSQTTYYQGNSSNINDQMVQIYGGVQYANTGGGWMNQTGTGFFGWGSFDPTRGYAGFSNYQGLGYRFQDFNNTGVRNVRFRVASNHTLTSTGTSTVARLNTSTSTNQNLIQSFLTDTSGRLNYESVATDGSTFNAGYLNYLTGQTSNTAPTTAGVWNINANSNSTPAYTPIVVASIGRPTGTGITPTLNYTNTSIAWSARSFTHTYAVNGTKDYGNTTQTPIGQQLVDLGSLQSAAQDPLVKQAAITAMAASSTANIDTYFGGIFTAAGFPDSNDVHNVLKYEWFKYTNNANAPIVTLSNVNFGNQNININSGATFTPGYQFDGSTWSFKAPAIYAVPTNAITGGLTTTGNITLTTSPSAAAPTGRTYAQLSGNMITLPPVTGTRGSFRLNSGTTGSTFISSPTFTVNNLPTALFPSGSVTTGPVSLDGTLAAVGANLQAALLAAMPGWGVTVTTTTAGPDSFRVTFAGSQTGVAFSTGQITGITPTISWNYGPTTGTVTSSNIAQPLLTAASGGGAANRSWNATTTTNSDVTISSFLGSTGTVGRINLAATPTLNAPNLTGITGTIDMVQPGSAGFQIDFQLPTSSPTLTIPTTITLTCTEDGYLNDSNVVSAVQNPVQFVASTLFVPLSATNSIVNLSPIGTVASGVNVNFGSGMAATSATVSYTPTTLNINNTGVMSCNVLVATGTTGTITTSYSVTIQSSWTTPQLFLDGLASALNSNATGPVPYGWRASNNNNTGLLFTRTPAGVLNANQLTFTISNTSAAWNAVFGGSPTQVTTNGTAAVAGGSSITMAGDLFFNLANASSLNGSLTLTPGSATRSITFSNILNSSQVSNLTLSNTALSSNVINVSGWPVGLPLPIGFRNLATFTLTLTFPVNVPLSSFRVQRIFTATAFGANEITPTGTGFGSTTVTFTFPVNTATDFVGCVFYVDGYQRGVAQTNIGATSLNVLFTPEAFIDFSLWNSNAVATDTSFVNSCSISATAGTTLTPGKVALINFPTTGYVKAPIPSGANPVEWGKNIIRKIEESSLSSAYQQSIAIGTVVSTIFNYNGNGIQVNSPADPAVSLSGAKTASSTSRINVPLYAIDSNGSSYNLNTGAATDVTFAIDYGGYPPGATANITTGQQNAIASTVSNSLVGTIANPGPLSQIARGVEAAQLLVPRNIPIPTA